ncbi:MAG: rRNA maturation RNase YbeY [Pseudomonadota bacterium]
MCDMAIDVDISVEGDFWGEVSDWEYIVNSAVAAAALHLQMDAAESELSILLTHDAVIRHLNEQWRDKDKPTNVLSFPAVPGGQKGILPPLLGDIVLAFETIEREAQVSGKKLSHHVSHLIVHGFLHLLGYDHESDKEAQEMETTEQAILARLGIDDPYAI